MLYDNPEVLEYLQQSNGKLIHVYGDPDSGRTSVLFSWVDYLTRQGQAVCYVVPRMELFWKDLFHQYVDKPERCYIAKASTEKEIRSILDVDFDWYCFDNFLDLILHKPKPKIRSLFSLLSGHVYQTRQNAILVNGLRYYEAKGGYHPAYLEYFRHYCMKHAVVEKDSDFHIRYRFTEA